MQLVRICKTALDVIEGEGPLGVPRDLHPLPGADVTVNFAACGLDLRLHGLDFSIEIERVFVGMIADFLQPALQEIRDHSDEHALDFDAEVEAMEAKIQTTRREIYGNISAWQRVQIARHTQRPFALDYVERCFTNSNE